MHPSNKHELESISREVNISRYQDCYLNALLLVPVLYTLNKESSENEVVDVHLNVPWAQQWELKSQVDGDQKN